MQQKYYFIIGIVAVIGVIFIIGCIKQNSTNSNKLIWGEVILIKDTLDKEYVKDSTVGIGYGKNELEYLCNPKKYIKFGEIEWKEKEDYFIGKYQITLNKNEMKRNEYIVTYDCACKTININKNKNFNVDFIFSEGVQCPG